MLLLIFVHTSYVDHPTDFTCSSILDVFLADIEKELLGGLGLCRLLVSNSALYRSFELIRFRSEEARNGRLATPRAELTDARGRTGAGGSLALHWMAWVSLLGTGRLCPQPGIR